MIDDKNDSVKELLTRHLAGETSVEEAEQVNAWLDQKPENEQYYNELRKVFDLSQQHYARESHQHLDINIDAEWNQFINQIGKPEGKSITMSARKKQSSVWYRVAAAAIILILSGFALSYFLNRETNIQYQTADNKQDVVLPDGSHVTLNRYSKLALTSSFGKEKRTLTLTGEGFFDVAHDKSKPFIINTTNARVEVVGTSFNVRAYDSLEKVEVTVQTGIVKFGVPQLNQEVKLVAGEKGVYTKENSNVTSKVNDDANFISWNTQKIVFNENTLQSVIETLNKTYHVNIVLSADVPASCVVTVTFDHQSLDAVLHVLESTLNLKYTVNGNRIEITSAGC
ncbi:MAG TPA: FecR domain-containing protein [Cyclobacteriaceae bacterium]